MQKPVERPKEGCIVCGTLHTRLRRLYSMYYETQGRDKAPLAIFEEVYLQYQTHFQQDHDQRIPDLQTIWPH